jgi:Flp pilus assembly protein TadB
VPEEEYAAIRRVQRRFRALPIALGLAVAALAIFFTLTGQVLSVFVLLPLSVATWFAFIRPLHRRRYRAAIADLPRWNLRAE